MKWVLGVLLTAAIGIGLAVTTTVPVATASIDDVSLRFLPPETQAIGFVDVAALREAPLISAAMKRKDLSLPRDVIDFASATGFDPQRDVDKITFGKLTPGEGLIIVQGRIDKFKAEQYLKQRGNEQEVYLGQTIFNDKGNSLLVLDNVVVFGQRGVVRKAVDQMQLPGSLPLRAELTAAMQTIEAGNQVWAVGNISVDDLNTAGIRGPAPAVDMLKSLRSGTYQMRVDTDLHARAVGNFADAESAKNVTDLARGFIAIARLQLVKQQPDFVKLLDGIDISGTGPALTVRIEEPGDLLKKLKDVK